MKKVLLGLVSMMLIISGCDSNALDYSKEIKCEIAANDVDFTFNVIPDGENIKSIQYAMVEEKEEYAKLTDDEIEEQIGYLERSFQQHKGMKIDFSLDMTVATLTLTITISELEETIQVSEIFPIEVDSSLKEIKYKDFITGLSNYGSDCK